MRFHLFFSPHDTDAYECVADISPENQWLIWIAIRSANVDDSVAIPFFLLCYLLQQLSTYNISSTLLVKEQKYGVAIRFVSSCTW